MNGRKSLLIPVLLLVVGAAPGLADTVTVGPGGAPTYDFALISDGVAAAADGDTVDIAGGDYDDWVGINGRNNLTLQGPTSGTPAVVKISASNAVNQGIFVGSNSSNITIKNLSVDMTANNGIEFRACISIFHGSTVTLQDLNLFGAGRLVDVFDGGRPTILNCNLHDATPRDFGNGNASAGVEIGGITSVYGFATATVDGCSFSGIGHPIRIIAYEAGTPAVARNNVGNVSIKNSDFADFGGEHEIGNRLDSATWAPDSTVLFEDCSFSNWRGYGIFTNSYPDVNIGPTNLVVRRCEMINDLSGHRARTAILLGYNSNILLENVVIAVYMSEGIYVQEPCGNITVHHCTVNNVNDSVMAQRLTFHNPSATIRNSILRTPNGFSWEVFPTYGSATSISYDIDYSIANSANARDFSTSIASVTRGANYTYNTANVNYPLFVDPEGDGDLHLQEGSPAINAGTNLGIATDVEGNPRDATPDIGAYQTEGGTGVDNWVLY